jgi:hypothetical protein
MIPASPVRNTRNTKRIKEVKHGNEKEKERIIVTAGKLDRGKKDCLLGSIGNQIQAKKDCTPLQ